MRTIHHLWYASEESSGEIEGMFDSNGDLLHFWFCNDATWRNHYFNPLMLKLGIEVKPMPDVMVPGSEKILETILGC